MADKKISELTAATTLDDAAELPLALSGANKKITGANLQTAITKLTTKGDLLGYGTGAARVAVGAQGYYLLSDSAQTEGLGWGRPLNVIDAVKEYGIAADAVPGTSDGTDDTTKLQTMIDDAHGVDGDPVGYIMLPGGKAIRHTGITIPQDVRIFGAAAMDRLSGGTELYYTGSDLAGAYAITTATSATNDFSTGLLSNLLLRCRSGYSNASGIYFRNAQNMARLSDLKIMGFPQTGVYADKTSALSGGDGTYPGYVILERVWVAGGVVPWNLRAGFSSLVFIMCAADGDSTTTDDWVIDVSNGTDGGKRASFLWLGGKSEDSGDNNCFTFNSPVAATIIGYSNTLASPSSASSFVKYAATPSSVNDPDGGIPVDLIGCLTSNRTQIVSCSTVTPNISLTVPAGSAGEVARTNWSGMQTPPAVWQGEHSGFTADGLTLTAPDASTVPLIINPAAAQTADLADFSSAVASDSFTRADSATTLGTASDGDHTWSADRGTWGISSNAGYQASTTSDGIATIDPGSADGVLRCDLTLSATSNRAFPGLVFRNTDKNNTLVLKLSKRAAGNEMYLQKTVAGATTTLYSASSMGFVNGQQYSVKVVLNGGSIKVYVDDALKIDYTLTGGDLTTFESPTKIGLYLNYGATNDDGGSRFDNLEYDAIVTKIDFAGKVLAAGLGVGNSVSASESIGKAVSRKIEVFDADGTSIGYLPVYSSIT